MFAAGGVGDASSPQPVPGPRSPGGQLREPEMGPSTVHVEATA